jgi:hypothetical protein
MSTDSTSPSKDTVWQTGLKRKIQQSVVYRRPLSLTEKKKKTTHWLRVRGWMKIYQANGPQIQAGIAILTFDKVDFKLTLIK